MGTRERILDGSLSLFNEAGTAQVSSLEIANSLGISPGNLYYHFKGKEEVLSELMAECELALSRLICRFDEEVRAIEDYQPFLFSVLRVCHHYRFLFRDQEAFRFADKTMRRRWTRLLNQLRQFSQTLLSQLNRLHPLGLNTAQLDHLADGLMLTTLGGLSFGSVTDGIEDSETQIRRAVARLAMLLAPYQQAPQPITS